MFSEYKLVTEKMKKEESADTISRTRTNNYLATSALSTFFDTGKEKKAMLGYGLPANVDKPKEAAEFYEVLRFFKANTSFFNKTSSKTVQKIMDLFSWEDDEEFKKIALPYFTNKNTRKDMYETCDIDLRKIAKRFAKDGDLSKGLKNIEEIKALDIEIAKYFENLKLDILKYYREHVRVIEEDNDEK